VGQERHLTEGPGGRILTNIGVWSPDGKWIVYDTRSDAAGEKFDGTRIEAVNAQTREVRRVYESRNGAGCGVATWHPRQPKIIFILGPENPTMSWAYGPSRRQGVIVDFENPSRAMNLDARDLVPPFTPGALRGGSHVHVFSPDGEWVSYTYEDEFLNHPLGRNESREVNLRNIGISVPAGLIKVNRGHERNHDGTYFSVLVTSTTSNPKPGSNEIKKAFEESGVGNAGYRRADGTWQRRALAFQGHVVTATGETISEVFVVDIPEDVRTVGSGPLQGTETRMPSPPHGTVQRRLTYTSTRKYPGIQGPRHWLRSSPDGHRIAFLMKDDYGIVQLWSISPLGGKPEPITKTRNGIASAFSWSPDGQEIACVCEGRISVVTVANGECVFLTPESAGDQAIRPEACVFSPDGKSIAYVRRIKKADGESNQICVVSR
jgi:hypothetical protein